jgi:uncharacterized protein (DUF1800 family)
LQVQVGNSNHAVTATAAARLLDQSTFGPTPALIQHVEQVGMQAFLNEQFAATASTYPIPTSNQDISVVKQRFFTNALTGQDQPRQRVAWALAQIFVVSNQKIGDPTAFSAWMNMLQKDAFANDSTLLNDVTLSPTMGNYLDMANNDKPDPNSGSQPNELRLRDIAALFHRPGATESGWDAAGRHQRHAGSHLRTGHHHRLRTRIHGLDLSRAGGKDCTIL